MLGGVGDDKTDIVVYAEWYKRDAIYSRDRDISSNADFTRLVVLMIGRATLPGVSEILFTSHSLMVVRRDSYAAQSSESLPNPHPTAHLCQRLSVNIVCRIVPSAGPTAL